jgi:hypothetical protein
MESGQPKMSESNMETPVTPPSMKRLDSRNPFSPRLAERMPSIIRKKLIDARKTLFIGNNKIVAASKTFDNAESLNQ